MSTSPPQIRRLDAIVGCLVGGALGDAVGSAYENSPEMVIVSPDRPWVLTDDTQLTLATCEAIVAAAGRVDPAGIAARFAEDWRLGRVCGAGASVVKALTELVAGGHWALVGRRGEMAAGNGAAMRIAPLAFALDPSDPNARTMIRDVCRITHHSEEAYGGALAVVWAVRLAYLDQWTEGRSLAALVAERLPDCGVRDRLQECVAERLTVVDTAAKFGAGGHVVQSVPLAVLAAERSRVIGFETMVKELVGLGGDTDTNASIAGQIAGARCGYAALPAPWIARLPESKPLLDLARRFSALVV